MHMCIYIYIYILYVCMYIYIYIYTHIYTHIYSARAFRAFRAYPLVEIRQAAPCRAIRGSGISVNSTLPPLIGKIAIQ